MDIREILLKLLDIPDNYDKHDFELPKYSFNDIVECVELVDKLT